MPAGRAAALSATFDAPSHPVREKVLRKHLQNLKPYLRLSSGVRGSFFPDKGGTREAGSVDGLPSVHRVFPDGKAETKKGGPGGAEEARERPRSGPVLSEGMARQSLADRKTYSNALDEAAAAATGLDEEGARARQGQKDELPAGCCTSTESEERCQGAGRQEPGGTQEKSGDCLDPPGHEKELDEGPEVWDSAGKSGTARVEENEVTRGDRKVPASSPSLPRSVQAAVPATLPPLVFSLEHEYGAFQASAASLASPVPPSLTEEIGFLPSCHADPAEPALPPKRSGRVSFFDGFFPARQTEAAFLFFEAVQRLRRQACLGPDPVVEHLFSNHAFSVALDAPASSAQGLPAATTQGSSVGVSDERKGEVSKSFSCSQGDRGSADCGVCLEAPEGAIVSPADAQVSSEGLPHSPTICRQAVSHEEGKSADEGGKQTEGEEAKEGGDPLGSGVERGNKEGHVGSRVLEGKAGDGGSGVRESKKRACVSRGPLHRSRTTQAECDQGISVRAASGKEKDVLAHEQPGSSELLWQEARGLGRDGEAESFVSESLEKVSLGDGGRDPPRFSFSDGGNTHPPEAHWDGGVPATERWCGLLVDLWAAEAVKAEQNGRGCFPRNELCSSAHRKQDGDAYPGEERGAGVSAPGRAEEPRGPWAALKRAHHLIEDTSTAHVEVQRLPLEWPQSLAAVCAKVLRFDQEYPMTPWELLRRSPRFLFSCL